MEMRPFAKSMGRIGTESAFEVMARARSGATVGAILEESQIADADLAEAMCTLLTRGVLFPRP